MHSVNFYWILNSIKPFNTYILYEHACGSSKLIEWWAISDEKNLVFFVYSPFELMLSHHLSSPWSIIYYYNITRTHTCVFLDLQKYILGGDDGLTLPQKANSINITLGDNSKLELREGLFRGKNNINSVCIQGVKNDFRSSNNHVVLTRNSLVGIYGRLPEISFKNLKHVTLREKSLDNAIEIVLFVESIWIVTVEKEVFGNTSYNATFNDIADLNLNEGFLRTSLTDCRMLSVFINRCHIKHLQPIRAKCLTELRIENSDVEIIGKLAFSSHEIVSLILNYVNIATINEDIFSNGVRIFFI